MAVITSDSFNPLRRFVSVRLQQGVPIVDAEWNEKDDVRRFELRAYLKWFVGDGVPHGSDAFLIEAQSPPAADDFTIRAGIDAAPVGSGDLVTGLRHVGRCLVDGLDATIEDDLDFRSQALHDSNASAADVAALYGTLVVPELPVLDGFVLVYLDVWDRLVRPDEDPALIFVDIGTESCARLRREWVVRTRLASDVPQPGDADFEDGHSYYALAEIARVAADPVVYPSQVVDLREKRLLTPPSTLIDDVLGTTPDRYRRGLDRPVISIRDAINALLRGELPASDDQVIAPDPGNDRATRAIVRVGAETLVFWHSNRAAAIDQVFGTSWLSSEPDQAGTNAPLQITAGAGADLPSVVLLPTSPVPTLWLAYQSQGNIHYRRATALAGLPAATEESVSTQAEAEEYAVAVRTDDIVTVLWFWNGPGTDDHIRYRRRQYDPTWDEGAAVWLDGETTDLSPIRPRTPSSTPGVMHAAADTTGRIWTAFRTFGGNIAVVRLTPATGAIETWTDIELDSGTTDQQPFVLADDPERVWIFWRGDDAIYHRSFDLAADAWDPATSQVPGTSGGFDENERPTAMLDDDGGLWLLWSREDAGGDADIWGVRRDGATGGWGEPRQFTASDGTNDSAFAFMDSGSIQLFFRSNRAGQFDLFFKQLVTAI
ncbi:MAG: hypothetical protein AAF682_04075 [Planctomycetota bacterium]